MHEIYMWAEVEVFVNNYSQDSKQILLGKLWHLKVEGKQREISAPLLLIPNEEEFSFIWVQFQFLCQYPEISIECKTGTMVYMWLSPDL